MRRFVLFICIGIICMISFALQAQQSWLKLEAGTEFSVALRIDNTLWAWGFNGNGQLGLTGNHHTTCRLAISQKESISSPSVGVLICFGIK